MMSASYQGLPKETVPNERLPSLRLPLSFRSESALRQQDVHTLHLPLSTALEKRAPVQENSLGQR